MTRLLFWLALAFLVIYAIRKKLRAAAPPRQADPVRPAAAPERVETMLPCTRCGVHVPHSEAVLNIAGMAFCSEEHRRLHDGA